MVVTMMCLTTKKKFEVEDPEVVVLKNGRYAFRAECPWKGKNEKVLTAFKFCSVEDYEHFEKSKQQIIPEAGPEVEEEPEVE